MTASTQVHLQEGFLEERLQSFFGYSTFRQCQKEIVTSILAGKDILAILPTGAGKSICYQLPALLMPGTAIVISPLISLMQDQVASLSKKGIPAAFLNSSLYYRDIRSVLDDLGSYKLLYVAPERFSDASFVQRLQQLPISFFAIDEAHCISQWGHSFRPEYRQMAFLKTSFPKSSIVALTATATREVETDIVTQLAMHQPKIVKSSFDRPNLTLTIQYKNNPIEQLSRFLKNYANQSGIVYAATRKTVDMTYAILLSEGFQVGKYHAGMTDTDRTKMQDAFINGQLQLIVATVAFGMGIHKADIRYIVHVDMPRNIEQYYQEIGRAGRDGLPSECLMLYGRTDLMTYKSFIENEEDATLRLKMKEKLDEMYALCTSNSCRRVPLLRYFGERYSPNNCKTCDNCLKKISPSYSHSSNDKSTDQREKFDASIIAQKILSCVNRLGESFGIKHVINVLRGSKSQNVLSRGHDRLSTYNLMAEHSEEEIRYYIEALIQMGFLKVSTGEYPLLQWTENSPGVIKGITKVMMQKAPDLRTVRHPLSHVDSVNQYIQGKSIEQIAAMKKLTKGTVLGHLTEQMEKGTHLDISRLVTPSRQEVIKKVIETAGLERLAPIKELLPEDYTYDEIRVVVALCRGQRTK